jgi:hypothetical protein
MTVLEVAVVSMAWGLRVAAVTTMVGPWPALVLVDAGAGFALVVVVVVVEVEDDAAVCAGARAGMSARSSARRFARERKDWMICMGTCFLG